MILYRQSRFITAPQWIEKLRLFCVNNTLLTLLNAAQAKEANPNTVDHAGLMQAWDEASLKRGQTIYNNLCVNCHGADGTTPSLPVARAFGTGELKFGTDPYSMFRTLTDGSGLMGPCKRG